MTANTLTLPRSGRLAGHEIDAIVVLYERGEASQRQLADLYGVHRNTIYRALRKREAVWCRRLPEILAEENANADQRQRQAQLARWAEQDRRLDLFIESMKPVHAFMRALMEAERNGTMKEFGEALRGF